MSPYQVHYDSETKSAWYEACTNASTNVVVKYDASVEYVTIESDCASAATTDSCWGFQVRNKPSMKIKWSNGNTTTAWHRDGCDWDSYDLWKCGTESTATYLDPQTFDPYRIHQVRLSPQQRLQQIIQERQAPAIHVRDSKRNPLRAPSDIREERARETLRRVVGDEKFRRFQSHGFVTARSPKTGRIYQIFPGHGLTCVWENGVMVERLCVVLRGNFPPTDAVIVRYLLAINNEEKLWEVGIKHGAIKKQQSQIVLPENMTKPLPEILRELKAA